MLKAPLAKAVWRNIRLELAPKADFPEGSASRAYMLRLPVREDGTIDNRAIEANPGRCGFRRFWPNEPDRSGQIIREEKGWALTFSQTGTGEVTYRIAMDRLLPGDQVTIEKQLGDHWLFRVVDVTEGSSQRC